MTERQLNQDPERIRRRRVAAGMDGPTFAKKAGISKTHLWQIEHGTSSASPEILTKVAAALDCTIEDLMPEVAA